VAQLARAFGWTMAEVRAHSMRDIATYAELLESEARGRRMAASRRAAGF
jgi:hypothetical protein